VDTFDDLGRRAAGESDSDGAAVKILLAHNANISRAFERASLRCFYDTRRIFEETRSPFEFCCHAFKLSPPVAYIS